MAKRKAEQGHHSELQKQPKAAHKQLLTETINGRETPSSGYMGGKGEVSLWRGRTLKLLDICLAAEAYQLLEDFFRGWPIEDVKAVTQEWTSHQFAQVFGTWRPQQLVALIRNKSARFIAKCCESWPPEELVSLLPKLNMKRIRKVLEFLYFDSTDKYLSRSECRDIMSALTPSQQRRLRKKVGKSKFDSVMNSLGDDSDSGLDEDDDEGDVADDDLDGFIVDDNEELLNADGDTDSLDDLVALNGEVGNNSEDTSGKLTNDESDDSESLLDRGRRRRLI